MTLHHAGRWIQTAFITDDMEASMSEFTRTLGAGPWFLRERGVFPNQVFRGTPSTTALSIALGYAGDMQIELIRQLDDSPSVYREWAERRGYGLHHYGIACSNYPEALEHYRRLGFSLVYEAEVVHGARVGYFDTCDRLPAMIEVIEYLPATQAMFETFRASACEWDGRDPVRRRA